MALDDAGEEAGAVRTVIQDWRDIGFLARLGVVVLAGVTWAVGGIQRTVVEVDYWDPVTSADFFAVYAYSVALLLTAAALLPLAEVARPTDPRSTPIILVASAAFALTGVANGLEDAIGIRGFGLLYVTGVLVASVGLIVVAILLWQGPSRGLAFVPGLAVIGFGFVNSAGGLLVCVAWLGFAVVLARERLSRRADSSPA